MESFTIAIFAFYLVSGLSLLHAALLGRYLIERITPDLFWSKMYTLGLILVVILDIMLMLFFGYIGTRILLNI